MSTETTQNSNVSKALLEAQANVDSKLILSNIGNNIDGPKLEKILKSYDVKYTKCKKPFDSWCGTVWFATPEDKEDAKVKLSKAIMKNGEPIRVVECAEANKRKLDRINAGEGGEASHKRQKVEEPAAETGPRHVNDVVTPMWHEPYEKQLKAKTRHTINTLTNISKRLKKAGAPLENMIQFVGVDGHVHPSEVLEGYRNKLSFTIGTDSNGVKRIGFSEGAFGKGKITVGDVSGGCILIGKRIEEIRLRLEKYVQESPRDVYHKDTHEGFWRQFEIRCFRTGETCAVVQVNPTGVSEEEIGAEKKALISVLGEEMKVTSLYFQVHDGISNFAQTVPELIFGPKYIRENILGLTFNVSPGSFFQTNSWTVETLYGIVRDWCKEIVSSDFDSDKDTNSTDNTTKSGENSEEIPKKEEVVVEEAPKPPKEKKRSILFDVCCGTGTIGQVLARDCFSGEGTRVVGVDIAEDAIHDAEENAKLNAEALSNCDLKYIAGKAEDHMRKMAESYVGNAGSGCNVIAVVDPPRSGLHPSVLKTLRNCWSITHIVYVSCNPNTLANDVEALCRPVSRSMPSKPFVPVKATGVDMFPHTDHLEMVMVLKRDPPKH